MQLESGGFIRVLGVSGTIRKAEERLIELDVNAMLMPSHSERAATV